MHWKPRPQMPRAALDGGVPASRIRVTLVIARLNIGGPATHVVQLAAGLPAERFEVRLIAGREGRGEGSMRRHLAERAGLHGAW